MERPDAPAPRATASNPLLSTAVTGVSLQDLTHHAVLLPAVAPDELGGRNRSASPKTPEKQRHCEDHNANRLTASAADAASSDPNANQLRRTARHDSSTAKPASDKVDDFDVNEYFARLQGTRYVSAPLNSGIREDKQKLEEAEENLEEINLLDDSRSSSSPTAVVQQSLTADIAQNFSQLPQSIPRVASAVFSSFSSILNLSKSKEPTPDPYEQSYDVFNQNRGQQNPVESYGEQGYPTERVAETPENVPTFSPDVAQIPKLEEMKPVGPPPVVGGASNTFRMASKKKTYAHIPGLSSTTQSPVNPLSVPPTGIDTLAPPNLQGPPRPADITVVESPGSNIFIPSSVYTCGNVIQNIPITPNIAPQPNVQAPMNEVHRGYTPSSGYHSMLSSPENVIQTSSNSQSATIIYLSPAHINVPSSSVPTIRCSSVAPEIPSDVSQLDVTMNDNLTILNKLQENHCSAVMEEISESDVHKNFDVLENHAESKFNGRVVELTAPCVSNKTRSISEESFSEKQPDALKLPISSAASVHSQSVPLQLWPTTSDASISCSSSCSLGTNVFSTLCPPPTSIRAPPPTLTGAPPPPLIGAPPKGPLTFTTSRHLLPPSIARRISNSQPVLKKSSIAEPNIFVPSTEPTQSTSDSTAVLPVIAAISPPILQQCSMSGNQSSDKQSVEIFPLSSAETDEQIKSAGLDSLNVFKPHGVLQVPELSSSSGQVTVFPEEILPEPPVKELQTLSSEPPKVSVKNFRLGSKRLQYYSGPIEGTGPISNTPKASLEPVFQINTTKNISVFTPVVKTELPNPPSEPLHDIKQSAELFYTGLDLSRPILNQQQRQPYNQYESTELPEKNPNEDSKTDLFGSIKSKLGSVNINKLQNVMTSFFDPAYYDNEKKVVSETPYGYPLVGASQLQASDYQQTHNFEISVPSYECNQVSSQQMYPQYTEARSCDQQIRYPQYSQDIQSQLPFSQFYEQPFQVSYSQHAVSQQSVPYQIEKNENYNQIGRVEMNQGDAILLEQNIKTVVSETHCSTQANDGSVQTQTSTCETVQPRYQVQKNTADCFDYTCSIKNTSDNLEPISYVTSQFIVPENLPVSMDTLSVTRMPVDIIDTETDRARSQPEILHVDKLQETDITSQLIENLTSPLQLFNPVEVPLREGNDIENCSTIVDNEQMNEISQITEETIETIQLQTSADFFERGNENENLNVNSAKLFFDNVYGYGWSVRPTDCAENQGDFYSGYQEDKNKHSKNVESILRNASDEIKAGLQKEEMHVLPREISIPSAPTLEDLEPVRKKSFEVDTLDVNLIEQDAKKDFSDFLDPYVIEPSETDDDKMVKEKSEESNSDANEIVLNDEDQLFVEQSSIFYTKHDPIYENVRHIYNPTERNTEKLVDTIYENIPKMASPIYENVHKPFENVTPAVSFASYFDTGNYASDNHLKKPTNVIISNETHNVEAFDEKEEPSIMTQATFITKECIENVLHAVLDDAKTSSLWEIPCKNESSTPPSKSRLPLQDENIADPTQFFSSPSESKVATAEPTFNLLASYFASPEKPEAPEHRRSFFELSEGQDHYMHPTQKFRVGSCQIIYDNCSFNDTLGTPKSKCFDLKSNADNINNEDTNNYSNLRLSNVKTSQSDNYFIPVMFDHDSTIENYKFGDTNSNIQKDEIEIKKNLDDINTDNYINYTDDTETQDINNTNHTATDEFISYVKNGKSEETLKHFESTLFVIVNNCQLCKLAIRALVETAAMDSDGVKVGSKDRGPDAGAKSDSNPAARSTVKFEDVVEENEFDVTDGKDDNTETGPYIPVKHHWYYRLEKEDKMQWKAFCYEDSDALEHAFHSPDLSPRTLVPTNGGRYDVRVVERLREAVYWTEKANEVRRCSWFCKGREGPLDTKFVPYEEDVAELLESEYRRACESGSWHRRVMITNGESVVLHGPRVMLHLVVDAPAEDSWSSASTMVMRPRVVRRGTEAYEVETESTGPVSHLLLLCHGIGSYCDLRFKPVEEVVDDFRATCHQLLKSHYKQSHESGVVGRVEVLPVSWHSKLHAGERGVDKRLAAITLDSIPRLRGFTNDTVLDVLFYTSPVYCQLIMDIVSSELERIHKLFRQRNPDFVGGVSFGGHSLGSVILFDLLCHQQPPTEQKRAQVTYAPGAGDTQPAIRYPQLSYKPDALYALGSPIAIFQCIRGIDALGVDFHLPTCAAFFNIFHPYDPIAYRIEPLINPEMKNIRPFLIPHHKGRKRMHLELKETMARVGADIKQRVFESLTRTWASMWKPPANSIQQQSADEDEDISLDSQSTAPSEPELVSSESGTSPNAGRLNGGRRVDYVLQEAPLELINEYLSAVTSHVCYWESSDVMLLMLREICGGLGVAPDSSVPQQSLTVEVQRTVDGPSTSSS